MKLGRVCSHLSGDFRPVLAWDLPALHSNHNFSAREVIENVYEGETSDGLTRKIKWTVEENADITVSSVHLHLIELAEPSKLYCINVLWRLMLLNLRRFIIREIVLEKFTANTNIMRDAIVSKEFLIHF